MSRKNGKDYLFLIWKHPESRRQYVVGILSKNGGFEFAYAEDIDEARKNGFSGIEAFKDFNKKYKSTKLFPVFSSRLPDKKRRGIEKILQKYNMNEYDEYLLLKNSGARLPIDTFEFIDPIFDEEEIVLRYFYIAGISHYLPCENNICDFSNVNIHNGDKLILKLEPENSKDEYAVEIYNVEGVKLGYIPRYYSRQVTERINKNNIVVCEVLEFNPDANCRECIRIKLCINKNNKT